MELSPSLISLTVSVDVKHYVLLYVVSKRRILSKIRAFCLVLSSSKAFSLTSCVFLIVVKKKFFFKDSRHSMSVRLLI